MIRHIIQQAIVQQGQSSRISDTASFGGIPEGYGEIFQTGRHPGIDIENAHIARIGSRIAVFIAADDDLLAGAVDGHAAVKRQRAGKRDGVSVIKADRATRADIRDGLAQRACAVIGVGGDGDGRGTIGIGQAEINSARPGGTGADGKGPLRPPPS